ncbi:hypothetical protein MYSTI_05509 [Myxococcus stipitatus DSM 14675]|uniref:Lipoprotein n=1 Tax=Myxococcus stipitatus (strain DSM 14675 / JCM 12634 / Mx s8) TaxID=1278073 RepID=L7UCY7_MYXSD|nr:hypothetical protein [Myxococcus stipitatus]AGC46786.1 hypothetical protein MYSTI_05509 [Myxococcus stipitatus DSM 14675]
MSSRMEQGRSFAGVAVLTLALAFMGSACGDDDPKEPQGTPDSGSNPDAGQPDAGQPDSGPAAVDSDVALARFTENGTLDTTFGAGGTARVDLTTVSGGTRDSSYGLAVDGNNRLVVFGNRRGDGDRVDADRFVMRFTADGARDTAFATEGVHTLNISNLSDGARHGIVDRSGRIVASGYTSQPTGVGAQAANRIVLLRLDDTGKPDNTFGWKGVVNSAPFLGQSAANPEWGMAEAYAVDQFSDGSYVTTGYGRSAASGTVDVVNFRFTAAGVRDENWGTGGVALLDLIGDQDRGRNLIVLNDDRVFTVGSVTPSAGKVAAMVFMLDKNGARDTTFAAEGYKFYDFERPEQAFFGVAKSKDGKWAAAAGYRTGASQDDDSVLAIIPVGGTGTEFAKAVPISETENDRFTSVAFDESNRVYAAGYVTEGGDNRMVIARYNTDGTLDTTFGAGGIVKHNFVVGKVEEAVRGIVIQTGGKVVVAGTADK